MTRDTFEVVHSGYMKLFPFMISIGRLCMMLALQLFQGSVQAAMVVLAFPLILGCFIALRKKKSMRVSSEADVAYNEKIRHVDQVMRCYRLIADYNRRPRAVDEFEKKIGAFNWTLIVADAVTVNNTYAAPWMSIVITGLWIIVGGGQ